MSNLHQRILASLEQRQAKSGSEPFRLNQDDDAKEIGVKSQDYREVFRQFVDDRTVLKAGRGLYRLGGTAAVAGPPIEDVPAAVSFGPQVKAPSESPRPKNKNSPQYKEWLKGRIALIDQYNEVLYDYEHFVFWAEKHFQRFLPDLERSRRELDKVTCPHPHLQEIADSLRERERRMRQAVSQ